VHRVLRIVPGHRCSSMCGETCRRVEFCQICAPSTTKEMVVDFILSTTFEDVDLDENPYIMPSCGHILTLDSMDRHMTM